jgi:hypothetical protein
MTNAIPHSGHGLLCKRDIKPKSTEVCHLRQVNFQQRGIIVQKNQCQDVRSYKGIVVFKYIMAFFQMLEIINISL